MKMPGRGGSFNISPTLSTASPEGLIVDEIISKKNLSDFVQWNLLKWWTVIVVIPYWYVELGLQSVVSCVMSRQSFNPLSPVHFLPLTLGRAVVSFTTDFKLIMVAFMPYR